MDVTGEPDEVLAALRTWLSREDDEPLVVATSGSTARPKRVRLSRSAVLASVAATATRLGGEGQWVLRLPPSYVAGVQVLVRSLVAGYEPVLPDDPWPAGEGWFTSMVPTQLNRALTDPAWTTELHALRRARAVLLGGGPVDPGLSDHAAEAGVTVVTTYGSAETAGGCVYDGFPLDGVQVAVDDDSRVRVAGPVLFDGYEDDAELTAQSLVDGWFITADAGRFDEEGRLELLGRLDDVVVSGGVNVPGAVVAATLRSHPGVAFAEVVGVPDDEWGQRVVAVVAPAGGSTEAPDTETLREWVAAEHPRSWAPRQVVAVEDIPLLDNGKPDRLALARMVQESG